MSVGVRRSACTAAMSATVAAVLATLPLAPPAAAAPSPAPGAHSGASPAPGGATAPPGAPGGPGAAAQPPAGDLSALLTRLKALYQQAEAADTAYRTAGEALAGQRARTRTAGTELAAARAALARSRAAAGQLALAQYRGRTGLPDYLALLLAPDPDRLLAQRHLLARAAQERAAVQERLAHDERRADALAADTLAELDKERQLAAARQSNRDTARGRLLQIDALLASLDDDRIARLASLEQADADRARQPTAGSGAPGPGGAPAAPSTAGAAAVRYAVRQLGKPYAWGAAGPRAFDCSGLTSQAWLHAGVPIPRTSQEQWRRLRRVPLDSLRPGDLVVYFPKATHVALYVGGGLVIQAPRPGTVVKVSRIAVNPPLGAVRPGPSARARGAGSPPPPPRAS